MEPHFGDVVVEVAKLRDYCLSDAHPRGRHKARVFRSRLGLGAEDAPFLLAALLDAVRDRRTELSRTVADHYGQRYLLDFVLTTVAGAAVVRSTWIVRTDDDVLRMVSCYVL